MQKGVTWLNAKNPTLPSNTIKLSIGLDTQPLKTELPSVHQKPIQNIFCQKQNQTDTSQLY